jgi:hypothetical protein
MTAENKLHSRTQSYENSEIRLLPLLCVKLSSAASVSIRKLFFRVAFDSSAAAPLVAFALVRVSALLHYQLHQLFPPPAHLIEAAAAAAYRRSG